MTPVKWEQVQKIFEAALPERFRKRVAAVQRPRAGDSQSKTQTDSRPAVGEGAADSPGMPTSSVVHSQPQHKASQSLVPGQIVAGRFEILRFLNSGGMGEVYEAWDSELRERVALKTIRPEIASSPSIIDRFKLEVKQARVISHVNVCRVYEVFSHEQDSGDRIWFFTMELLEGSTLLERLRQQGPFAPNQALELIEQMVAGLAAAHQLGIVHRDFKSSNVMLVGIGAGRTRAVITDFGLALNVLSDPSERGASRQGTPHYMAPEQERGDQVGFAVDQYALGVVICEMITSRLPSRPDSTGRVLLPPDHRLSRRWEAVIDRCLAFRPEDRFNEIRDVILALHPRTHSKKAWIVGAMVVLITMVVGLALLSSAGDGGSRVEGVAQLTPATDLTSRPSLSRDGQLVAYSSDRAEAGNLDIWVQRLPSGRPIRLTTNPAEDVDPNIAPDGSSVVFRSERNGGGIYVAEVTGGGERLLVPGGRNPRFSPDGGSVAYWVGDPDETAASGQLFLLSVADRSSVRLAADFKDARLPVWSSDGQFILFTGCRTGDQPMPACSEWWVTSRDGTRIQNTGSLALLRSEQIHPIDEIGGWYRDMVLFSGRRGTTTSLWELAIPRTSLRGEGKPRQLTSGDAREVAPSLADNDTIAFEHLTGALHVWRLAHASNPKDAGATKLTQDAALDISPSISHDGRWLTFSRGLGSPHDIWTEDMQSGGESLFLASAQDKFSPIIDDSGRTVVFEGRDGGVPSIFTAIRGEPARRICTGCGNPTGWFGEDQAVLYREGMPSKIKIVDLRTGETRIVLEARDYSLSEATWSPETQYLLFTASRDGNTNQVFAVLLPKSTRSATGEWIPITSASEFSDRPRWSGDGNTIFYLSNRDGFSCVWGQHFDTESRRVTSRPFAVMHYHNPRFSPGAVGKSSFNLSVSGDSVYLNVGEINTSIWTGVVRRHDYFSFLSRFR
jgi:serine/threonine protein kinase/Tol biopolymer transport system component